METTKTSEWTTIQIPAVSIVLHYITVCMYVCMYVCICY